MKIAYLSTFYPYRGGIAQFNAALYRQLAREHTVSAYTFTVQYPDVLFPGKTQYVQPGDHANPVEATRMLNTVNPLTYLRTARAINRFGPDLLLTKFWMPYFGPSLGYVAASMSRQCQRVSILDNVIPHEARPGDMALIRYFLNRNDGFVVMSEAVKQDLLTLKPDARYVYHPHPLYDHFGAKADSAAARAQLGLPAGKKILLCFGFIRDYKGIDLAIAAMQRLGPEYHLVIAGEVYGNFDKYQEQIDASGAADRISVFTRYIPDDETALFFSAADVCLLPYKSATQSGIVAIAYHFDLPVIATRVGGLAEMIEPYGAGIMTDDVSPEAIAAAVERYFATDPGAFVRNVQQYKAKASWPSLADTLVQFAADLKR